VAQPDFCFGRGITPLPSPFLPFSSLAPHFIFPLLPLPSLGPYPLNPVNVPDADGDEFDDGGEMV